MITSLRSAKATVTKWIDVAHNILKRAEVEGREQLDPAEGRLIEEVLDQAEALQSEIDAEEPHRPPFVRTDPSPVGRLQAMEQHLAALPKPRTLLPDIAHHAYGLHGGILSRVDQRYTQVDPRSYAGMFGPPAPSPWTDDRQFIQTIYRQEFDPRLRFEAALNEGTGSAGGYMVPQPMAAAILDSALHQEIIRPRCTVVPMTSRTILVPAWDGTDQSSGLYGMSFTWVSELPTITPGSATARAIELTAHTAVNVIPVSIEIEMDAPTLGLESAMATNYAESADHAFLRGTGAGQPLGILNSGARIAVSKEGGQAGGTVVTENLLNMFSRAVAPQTAVWIISPSVIPQLMSLTIAPFSSLPMTTQAADGSLTMLSRPVLISSQLPTLGSEGDVLLASLSWYYVGLRAELLLEKSRDAGFLSNSTYWRMLCRLDGQPKVDAPLTGRDVRTYSPFVVLATRA